MASEHPTPKPQKSVNDKNPPLTADLLQGIVKWWCPNCGQYYFCAKDETPPDICHFCRDMTTWQRKE
jgi:rubrerythrin